MAEQYLMALDQGTTSSRCIIFDKSGNIKTVTQREFTQYYPRSGWVEHNPLEIWSTELSVAMEALAVLSLKCEDIASLGITNQRETTIIWDKNTGEPVYNAIVWQCRRTADMIDEIVSKGYSEKIRSITGLVPDAYFSASKIKWILDNVEGVRERADKGELLFGTVDTWLIWKLTKGSVHATDYTNASRTMLFDIHKLEWSDELLEIFDIPKQLLPEVRPSSYIFGHTEESVLGGRIPIGAAAGDQQSALFGQCCFNNGDVKNTYGTGSFILMNTGKKPVNSSNGLLTTIAAGEDDTPDYALEGSVFVAGACVQWLRDEMKLVENAAKTQKCAEKAEEPEGVYMVPAFTGLGAPYWNPYARGSIFGITRGLNRDQFIRIALESIAYQSYDVFKAMEEDAGVSINNLKVDGGASANDFLMQFQSNISGCIVKRPSCIETTALGAAYLAGLAVGYYRNRDEIVDNWQKDRDFVPDMDPDKREELIKGWKRAVKAALFWADER
ncbi:MAG: glycerol kinase GlpK [Lachnospiraceae bacterium]|nr:glycerol kinase GlpK [Lachnospiraceae bacterium]